jgi:hypothetical protein
MNGSSHVSQIRDNITTSIITTTTSTVMLSGGRRRSQAYVRSERKTNMVSSHIHSYLSIRHKSSAIIFTIITIIVVNLTSTCSCDDNLAVAAVATGT